MEKSPNFLLRKSYTSFRGDKGQLHTHWLWKLEDHERWTSFLLLVIFFITLSALHQPSALSQLVLPTILRHTYPSCPQSQHCPLAADSVFLPLLHISKRGIIFPISTFPGGKNSQKSWTSGEGQMVQSPCTRPSSGCPLESPRKYWWLSSTQSN